MVNLNQYFAVNMGEVPFGGVSFIFPKSDPPDPQVCCVMVQCDRIEDIPMPDLGVRKAIVFRTLNRPASRETLQIPTAEFRIVIDDPNILKKVEEGAYYNISVEISQEYATGQGGSVIPP